MDFSDTPEEAEFRASVRKWLEANAQRARGTSGRFTGTGTDDIGAAKAWQASKYEAGYAAITVPEVYGGRGGTPIQALIYRQEESAFAVPTGVYEIGLGMCVPTVMMQGSDAHRDRFLVPAYRGDEIWCQLFSEPAGGSDIAALRTRAVRDGDDWVINGQKVWTSGAHFADFGILLARTDPTVAKHKGLTMFIVDMKAPGVDVRPIEQMSGGAEFNEVFFADVRIPDSDRLGAEGDGWNVALGTLMMERMSAGQGFGFFGATEVLELARKTEIGGRPASSDARVRERVADWWINEQGLKLLSYRAQTALSKGELPGPEQSVNKAIEAPQAQEIAYFAMQLRGQAGSMDGEEIDEDWVHVDRSWLWAPGMRLGGGTDEVLRNIIAERVLGLPGDVRVDKGVPFNQLTS